MRKFWPAGVIILVVLAIGGGWLALNSNSKKLSPVLGPDEALPTPADRYSTWEDPAGFKFTYPAEIKIEAHPEDAVNYANLDLGQIKILMTDRRPVTSPAQSLATELGGRPAQKEIFSAPAKIMVLTQDGNATVTVEVNLEGEPDYWQKIFNDLLASFEFIPLASEPTKPASPPRGEAGGSGVVEEGEEIIE